jgi:hypothetical protein
VNVVNEALGGAGAEEEDADAVRIIIAISHCVYRPTPLENPY